jgi:hypothetical protein
MQGFSQRVHDQRQEDFVTECAWTAHEPRAASDALVIAQLGTLRREHDREFVGFRNCRSHTAVLINS